MSDDEDSSQEGVDAGMMGGLLPDESMKALSSGTAGSGGGVSLQMLKAAARKKAASSKPSNSSKGRLSSSSRTRQVVKLSITSVSRSYNEPWRRRQQRESSGTGFLVHWNEGSDMEKPSDSIRIVTNAHVVRNASTIRARASFGPHVVSCDCEWISLPLDLALLKISEGDWTEFCKGWKIDLLDNGSTSNKNESANPPPDVDTSEDVGNKEKDKSNKRASSICLTLSSGLPKLDENVTCVGFPMGGTQISVTRVSDEYYVVCIIICYIFDILCTTSHLVHTIVPNIFMYSLQ